MAVQVFLGLYLRLDTKKGSAGSGVEISIWNDIKVDTL